MSDQDEQLVVRFRLKKDEEQKFTALAFHRNLTIHQYAKACMFEDGEKHAKKFDVPNTTLSAITGLKRDISLVDAKISLLFQEFRQFAREMYFSHPELPPDKKAQFEGAVKDRMRLLKRELTDDLVHAPELINFLADAAAMVGIKRSTLNDAVIEGEIMDLPLEEEGDHE